MRWVPLPASKFRRALVLLVETLLLGGSFLLATWLRLGDGGTRDSLVLAKAFMAAFVIQLFLYYGDLYERFASPNRVEFLSGLARAFVGAIIALTLIFFTVPALRVGRGILLLFLPFAFIGLFAWRSFALAFWNREALRDTVLILGTGQSAQLVAREALRLAPLDFQIVGFLGDRPSDIGRSIVNPSVIGTMSDLSLVVEKQRVSVVVVALEDFRNRLPVADLLRCRMSGVKVEEAITFLERLTGRIHVKDLRPSWFVFSEGFSRPRVFGNAKRSVELGLALVGLVLVSPFLALLALLLKLDSSGPVLYAQERVGEKGKVFRVLKLRTMRADAETASGPVWSQRGGDPRVTRLGRLMRKLRLDELPQLVNVLRGEMSFVGPRPERPFFVAQLGESIPFYALRLGVKPGITGWAQVRYAYANDLEEETEKMRYDLYYIKHLSSWLDLRILFETVRVVLFARSPHPIAPKAAPAPAQGTGRLKVAASHT
jgi:sugar transferase (PEP-CTERM system associated)